MIDVDNQRKWMSLYQSSFTSCCIKLESLLSKSDLVTSDNLKMFRYSVGKKQGNVEELERKRRQINSTGIYWNIVSGRYLLALRL